MRPLRLLLTLALLAPIFAHQPARAEWPQPARLPIVFIPGLMGSRLFNNPNNGPEEEVWADVAKLSDLFGPNPLRVLALAPDGVSPAEPANPDFATVHTRRGTPGMLTRLQGVGWGIQVDEDFYDTLTRHFTETQGFVEGVDFWVYPYDWRKDLRASADELEGLIQNILWQTGARQVNLVAHSLGGLVTRQYLSKADRAARVAQAVLLGTPFLGTPKSLYVLQEGDCLYAVNLILFTVCLPEASAIRELVPNYPAFYQIMPSPAYFALKGGGFYGLGQNVDVGGQCPAPLCLSYADTYTTARAPTLNLPLFNDAHQFHAALDKQTQWGGVPVAIIGGVNQSTVVGIREYQQWSWACLCYETIREPVETTAGDGTVALLSVRLTSLQPVLSPNWRGTATFRAFETDHLGLVKSPEVLAYVDALLGLAAAVDIAEPVETTGVQILATNAVLQAYDEQGRHTGPVILDGQTHTATLIPGSDYWAGPGRASLALVGGRTYTLTVEPTGNGPVDLSIMRTQGEATLTLQHYLGLTQTLSLVGDPWVVNEWQSAPGKSVGPTSTFAAEQADTTPPTLQFAVTRQRGRMVIALSGADDAGLARIEYAFSNDKRVRMYTDPIVVAPRQTGTLYALAIDLAGNQSLVSALTLDK